MSRYQKCICVLFAVLIAAAFGTLSFLRGLFYNTLPKHILAERIVSFSHLPYDAVSEGSWEGELQNLRPAYRVTVWANGLHYEYLVLAKTGEVTQVRIAP